MADELVAVAFDYGGLDKKSVASLERHAAAIAEEQAGVRRRAAEGVIKVGRELAAAHDLLAGKGREGLFRPWVQEACDFTYQTAYHAIQAAETFGGEKCKTVLHLFDVTALYLLSSDSCSQLATREAMRLAKKGQRITKKLALQLRDKHAEPEEPAPEQIEQDYDDVREMGEEGDQDDRQAGDAQDAAREPAAHEPEDPPAQEEPEADTEQSGPDEDDSQEELPLPSPVSPAPPRAAQAGTPGEVSVLGKLRSSVLGLAARTRDRSNLVRSLRTLAIPDVIHALAGALQGHAPPAVGNFLLTLAEEIEEADA